LRGECGKFPFLRWINLRSVERFMRLRSAVPDLSLIQHEGKPTEFPTGILAMFNPESKSPPSIRVMLGGDAMLGRNVKECILRFGAEYPLGPVAGLMRDADLTIVNLECAITDSDNRWSGVPKAFYFGAPPQAVQTLLDAGVDMVSLANNHILDYDTEGLLQTLHHLQQHGILFAGAGVDLAQAQRPAILECRGIRLGMAAFCDHQADFAAQAYAPGIAYLDFGDEPAVLFAWRSALEALQREAVHCPVLSLHWGPNMVLRPSKTFRRLAHAAIDMGWKVLFGHSAHVFHGIEIYRGCPLIYAAGDLVDDYHVDPEFANDHQLLFELELDARSLRCIRLHPVFIGRCQTRPADLAQAARIVTRMTQLCAELGTTVRQEKQMVWIQ
jgi:poly-gamma-glutamate synthesis protein (capsule biosynthesis protein)